MKIKKTDYTKTFIKDGSLDYLREEVGREPYDQYRQLWSASEKLENVPTYPLQLDFELNYSCNFTCVNCTWNIESTGGKGKLTWFPLDEFQSIIDEGVKKGLKAIRLNYINEPLIRKDLFKFIKYAKQAGIIDIYLSTNGSLLDEKNSKNLINSGLMRLQVSIDAYTEKTFNKMRQGGNFEQVKKNIFNFIKIRNSMGRKLPLLRVNFVRTKDNEHELNEFISFWTEHVDGIGIQDLVGIMEDFKSRENINKDNTKEVTFKCSQPFNHLTIRYDGSILPCCSFFGAQLPIAKLKSNAKLSNVENVNFKNIKINTIKYNKTSILEAWNSTEINFLREIHLKGEYFRHPVCKRCVETSSHNDNTN